MASSSSEGTSNISCAPSFETAIWSIPTHLALVRWPYGNLALHLSTKSLKASGDLRKQRSSKEQKSSISNVAWYLCPRCGPNVAFHYISLFLLGQKAWCTHNNNNNNNNIVCNVKLMPIRTNVNTDQSLRERPDRTDVPSRRGLTVKRWARRDSVTNTSSNQSSDCESEAVDLEGLLTLPAPACEAMLARHPPSWPDDLTRLQSRLSELSHSLVRDRTMMVH